MTTPPTSPVPPSVGPWIKLPTLISLEAVYAAGPDFVCLDMCNGWLSIERVAELLALRPATCRRLVRLPSHATPDVAGQILDAGADGLVFAHVGSADQARSWVEATRFTPRGTRGMGGTGRAGGWGLGQREDYLALADPTTPGRITVGIMIEDREAVAQVQAIAAVEGVDQLVVGSADLGMAYADDPVGLERAVDAVAAACVAHGKSAAVALANSHRAAEMVQRSYDALYVSTDITLLARAAAREFTEARGVLAKTHPADPVPDAASTCQRPDITPGHQIPYGPPDDPSR